MIRLLVIATMVVSLFSEYLMAQPRIVVVSGLVARALADGYMPIEDVGLELVTTSSGGTVLAHDRTTRMGLYSLSVAGVQPDVDRLYLFCTEDWFAEPIRLTLQWNQNLHAAKAPLIIALPRNALHDLTEPEVAFALEASAQTAALKMEAGLLDQDSAFGALESAYVDVMKRVPIEARWREAVLETAQADAAGGAAELLGEIDRAELTRRVVESRQDVIAMRSDLERWAEGGSDSLQDETLRFLAHAPRESLLPEWIPERQATTFVLEKADIDTNTVKSDASYLMKLHLKAQPNDVPYDPFADRGKTSVLAFTGKQLKGHSIDALRPLSREDAYLKSYLIYGAASKQSSGSAREFLAMLDRRLEHYDLDVEFRAID